jgi:hypothetical protein
VAADCSVLQNCAVAATGCITGLLGAAFTAQSHACLVAQPMHTRLPHATCVVHAT